MSNEFLTFTLDNTKYAVEISKVQEVLECKDILKIPCSADYIDGIINSRGKGISVVNLRTKFGLAKKENDKYTRIIVFEVNTADAMFSFGAIADSVQEVIELEKCDINDAPELGKSIASRFVKGLGRRNGEFLIMLDIDQLFSAGEADSLIQAAESMS